MTPAKPLPGGPQSVEVIKTEEKGSDVNLATYLLADAFRADAGTFVVVSNDSDLMEPIRLVSQELGYRVGVLNPHPNVNRALQRTRPSFTKQIRRGVLVTNQFPEKLSDAHGTITKPATW